MKGYMDAVIANTDAQKDQRDEGVEDILLVPGAYTEMEIVSFLIDNIRDRDILRRTHLFLLHAPGTVYTELDSFISFLKRGPALERDISLAVVCLLVYKEELALTMLRALREEWNRQVSQARPANSFYHHVILGLFQSLLQARYESQTDFREAVLATLVALLVPVNESEASSLGRLPSELKESFFTVTQDLVNYKSSFAQDFLGAVRKKVADHGILWENLPTFTQDILKRFISLRFCSMSLSERVKWGHEWVMAEGQDGTRVDLCKLVPASLKKY